MTKRSVNLAGVPVVVGDAENYRPFWDRVDEGSWEPSTFEAITQLANDAVYIDIGAWIGPTVLAAARSAATVLAYEPDPVAAAELHRNLKLNRLANVEVRPVALLDRVGSLPMSSGGQAELGMSESSLVYGSGRVRVPVLDARAESKSDIFSRCSLLKIDVEGGEYKLIRRLAPYLRKHQPNLLLSVHGVHWRRRHFRHLPGLLGRIYRRLRSSTERLTLLWRIRHYPYTYLDTGEGWVAISGARYWRLVGIIRDQALLLTRRPYATSEAARTG